MEHDLEKVTRWGKVPAWWLLHDEMDADRFCVMAALATYADEDGMCEPSQATLARRLKRSRPWVNKVVAELANAGLLEKTARHRQNGGTTSCRYRLAMVPPSGDTEMTGPVSREDSPRHGGDTNHRQSKQIQDSRPMRATAVSPEPPEFQAELHPEWQPSPEVQAQALQLYPDANLEEHTALFVSRSVAKGYRYRPGNEGRVWLSWLIEHRRDRKPGETRTGAVRPPRPGRAPDRVDRLAAWATAAGAQAPWS
jgi:hypothetical protein